MRTYNEIDEDLKKVENELTNQKEAINIDGSNVEIGGNLEVDGTFKSNGGLDLDMFDSGDAISVNKLSTGEIQFNAQVNNNKGIEIENEQLRVMVDGETIGFNEDGQLKAIGGAKVYCHLLNINVNFGGVFGYIPVALRLYNTSSTQIFNPTIKQSLSLVPITSNSYSSYGDQIYVASNGNSYTESLRVCIYRPSTGDFAYKKIDSITWNDYVLEM